MGTRVYKNVKVYSGGYDISGDLNTVALEYAFDEVEATTFNSECRFSKPGIPKITFSLEGFAQSDGDDAVEDVLAATNLGTASVPTSWSPVTGADGEVAYSTETLLLNYSPGGTVGDMYAFTASGVGQGSKLVRGTIMAAGEKTSTADGTARQLGAVTATQYVYAVLHVLEVSGTNPTLDVIVESDDAVGFESGATKITFTQASAVGAEFKSAAGAITDDYWRVGWTIGGTDTPSFTFAVVVGIL